MMPRPLVLVLSALACALFFSGCFQPPEDDRPARLAKMRDQVTTSFFVGSLIYVCVGLMGPTVSENARLWAASQFKLSSKNQIALAWLLYAVAIGLTLWITFKSEYLTPSWPSVIILLAGTFYSFLGEVIPSLRTGEVNRRKLGVGQIKSFFMLIAIFYVIMKFLSPEGLGDLKAA